MTFGC